MHEQLTMDLQGTEPAKAPSRPSTRHAAAPAEPVRPAQRRRHRPVGGPRRGEPDVPDDTSAPFVDWRIDPATRNAGLQGLARARAALEASGDAGDRRDHAA